MLSETICTTLAARLSKNLLSELYQYVFNEPPSTSDKNQLAFELGSRKYVASNTASNTSSSSSSSSSIATEASPVSNVSFAASSNPESATTTPAVSEDTDTPYSIDIEKDRIFSYPSARLKKILETYGVETNGNHDDLVLKVVLLKMPSAQRQSIRDKREEFLRFKGRCKIGSKPFVNQLYANTFSSVDTFDRRFYEIFKANQIKNWETTAILSLSSFMGC